MELSGADRPPNAGGAAANWRGVAEDRRRRHHSSGAKQQSYGGGGGSGGCGSGGHFTGVKKARYGGPFSDFNLYPDRWAGANMRQTFYLPVTVPSTNTVSIISCLKGQ